MKKLKSREEFLNEGHSYDNEIEKARKMQGSASELVEWAVRKVAESKPENFKEGVNEGATPRLLKSAGQNLARQVKGIKNYTEEQLKDRLLSTPLAKMLSDDEILTVLDHAKEELGMDEAKINEAARSNEALKYVISKYKDDRVNSVTFDEILVPLANHLDDYADRMMGDLEYSKKTFAAFKSLVDLMTEDQIESDKYN